MDMLRFITAGSVDDGKSTLIGRLLYDSKAISLDILEAMERSSKNKDNGDVDLSFLTDGLRAEREQGITIDVAYKYVTTSKRKFIIADAPGHVQYTRNMVTGASNADLAIILIDARNGVAEQTCRHTIIASLLGIPDIVVCVNKIDLVDYSEKIFKAIVEKYTAFSKKLDIKNVVFIPVSAKHGDNIVEKSTNISWYNGPTLLRYLEDVEINGIDNNLAESRFSVQYIIRPGNDLLHDYRGYAGRIISGSYKKGDAVTIFPVGHTSRIKSIEVFGKEVEEAIAPMPVVLHLEDDIDISRGDYIARQNDPPLVTSDIEATICWMNEKPLIPGARLLLQHQSKVSKVVVKDILHKIDINTFEKTENEKVADLNAICKVTIKSASPFALDAYKTNRANGGFILVDENTNNTVAAGIVS